MARDWSRGYRRSEQPFKERWPGKRRPGIGVVAGEADASRQVAGRMGVARLRMRNHVFQILASGVAQQRQHGGGAAIDVLAKLQLAGSIHKRRLVADVDR